MLFRFCLYGFLKNQQYYDLFLLLALRQKGISFAQYGLLIGFREICINALEVPTGAAADVLGRRRSMAACMIAYMGAFVLLATAANFFALLAAMGLFALGEALRTGTHKAIIFDWLSRQGRADEKTRFYGLTRSWSQIGSAVSVLVAAGIVCKTGNYSAVFAWCLIPYAINLVNLATYPRELDGPRRRGDMAAIARTLTTALSEAWRRRPLRRALVESMGFEGLYKSTKDYLQPVLVTVAASLPILASIDEGPPRTALLAAAVGLPLYLLGSAASRGSHRLTARAGGEMAASRFLWVLDLAAFAALGCGAALGSLWLMIAAFASIAVLDNLWLPVVVSRVVSGVAPERTATVLSIKSQSKSLFVAIVAPLLGWSVDLITAASHDGPTYMASWRFLPIAAIGVAISLGMLIAWRRRGEADTNN